MISLGESGLKRKRLLQRKVRVCKKEVHYFSATSDLAILTSLYQRIIWVTLPLLPSSPLSYSVPVLKHQLAELSVVR
jgi:hypothetical protein